MDAMLYVEGLDDPMSGDEAPARAPLCIRAQGIRDAQLEEQQSWDQAFITDKRSV
jgi:hypothetical protein